MTNPLSASDWPMDMESLFKAMGTQEHPDPIQALWEVVKVLKDAGVEGVEVVGRDAGSTVFKHTGWGIAQFHKMARATSIHALEWRGRVLGVNLDPSWEAMLERAHHGALKTVIESEQTRHSSFSTSSATPMTPPKSVSRERVAKGQAAMRAWRESESQTRGAGTFLQNLSTDTGANPENLVSMLSPYAPKSNTPAARNWLDDRVGELTYLLEEQGIEARAWKVDAQSPTADPSTVKHMKLIEIEFPDLVSIRELKSLMAESVVFVESGTPVEPGPEKRTGIRALKPRQNLPSSALARIFSYINQQRLDKRLVGATPGQASPKPRM